MCQLLETIRVVDGLAQNIKFHNCRMKASINELFATKFEVDIGEISVPEQFDQGVYKCRIVYSEKIDKIEYEKYTPKDIKSLRLIECNDIDYHLKYKDRSALNELVAQKGSCDDIIIVKDGKLTDMSYANLIFFDGENWITPSTPLLNGTRRQQMLADGLITEQLVTVDDLNKYIGVKVINAMLLPKETNIIGIDNILM